MIALHHRRLHHLPLLALLISTAAVCEENKTHTLKQQLWESVEECVSYETYSDFKQGLQSEETLKKVIDDSSNGYLHVAAQWPPCGCPCSGTSGAYRDNQGTYTLLTQATSSCENTTNLRANKPLQQILPHGLSLDTFAGARAGTEQSMQTGMFYVEIDIPQKGTQTTLTLKPLPIGHHQQCQGALCYSSAPDNKSNYALRAQILAILKHPQAASLLSQLRADAADQITNKESQELELVLQQSGLQEKQAMQLLQDIQLIYKQYVFYQRLHHTQLVMGWDRAQGRFVIVQKRRPPVAMRFIDFLEKGRYLQAVC